MYGAIYLEDGTVYEGKGFGFEGTSCGELVFNTSMTGYQEILTDPSYAGQIITMTYPLIGNYGVNSNYNEAKKSYAKGLIIKSLCEKPSNFMSENNLDKMMKDLKIVGVYGIDTRSLTKKIRNSGAMKCIISNKVLKSEEIKNYFDNWRCEDDWMKEVGVKGICKIEGTGPKVVLVDFGVKKNIIRNLMKKNCEIIVVPYNTPYEVIMALNPEGILLSNGPGDPKCAVEAIEMVKKIMSKLPVFGICLGHQILSLAAGGETYKMKFGHRGGNHGVIDIKLDKSFITSQNHGYAVQGESLKGTGMIETFKNLNDDTVEGIEHEYLPVFSVQFHPEGAPGPEDTSYLFDKFINYMKEGWGKGEK
ncbi:glutamine-hydrolyzing carbamoyl-phosphate synthase small subunit [Oceanirhabdus sp. W0125-5]|uniref:glutamine-hydrolyzing carbamoyl-phosphate synthase small subunit n=1 Tax=Oceanirhabdus sp. W0125-5 TaxID=2999116 RepID=UPI0022F34556|nr:glutamine-hydrolyzing carbamoyl-phosphate synthase small subunit [Oceanirhabdus sp. W0125-5]WBW95697.1 glutamine-hydrolyzing carbamoyl-phosphate synthase small subunit [Oceanirhabdus sp. W0125-5]